MAQCRRRDARVDAPFEHHRRNSMSNVVESDTCWHPGSTCQPLEAVSERIGVERRSAQIEVRRTRKLFASGPSGYPVSLALGVMS